jgi:hypothetical protein
MDHNKRENARTTWSNNHYKLNSAPSPLFYRVLRSEEAGYSSFRDWLKRHLFKSCIVPPRKLFPCLSSIIALKDRGFEALSSALSDWVVYLKAKDGGVCSVSWSLIYRASLYGFDGSDFHQSCDGMGSCVVVLRAENGRFAAAYNDDGFSSFGEATTNRNGFILSIKEDGSCGAQFDRNESRYGTFSNPNSGPDLYNDLFIFSNCHENELSRSLLGRSYGSSEVGADKSALFGQSG